MIKYVAIVVGVGLLTACGGSKDEKPEGVIPDHMVESMDRAENVGDVLKQADQQRREQSEE